MARRSVAREVALAWFVPSRVLAETVTASSRGRLRFAASLRDNSSDRWRPYLLTPAELPGRILAELHALDAAATR